MRAWHTMLAAAAATVLQLPHVADAHMPAFGGPSSRAAPVDLGCARQSLITARGGRPGGRPLSRRCYRVVDASNSPTGSLAHAQRRADTTQAPSRGVAQTRPHSPSRMACVASRAQGCDSKQLGRVHRTEAEAGESSDSFFGGRESEPESDGEWTRQALVSTRDSPPLRTEAASSTTPQTHRSHRSRDSTRPRSLTGRGRPRRRCNTTKWTFPASRQQLSKAT